MLQHVAFTLRIKEYRPHTRIWIEKSLISRIFTLCNNFRYVNITVRKKPLGSLANKIRKENED